MVTCPPFYPCDFRTSTLARGSRALAVTTPENPEDSNMRMAAEGYARAARERQPQAACWMALGVDLRRCQAPAFFEPLAHTMESCLLIFWLKYALEGGVPYF